MRFWLYISAVVIFFLAQSICGGGTLCTTCGADHTNFTTYDIAFLSEASAVTYRSDTQTLYSIGDEGAALFQMSKTGAFIDQMTFDNSGHSEGRTLNDPEGLSYANGNFYISDERRNVAWKTPYAAGTQVGKGVMPFYVFGAPRRQHGTRGSFLRSHRRLTMRNKGIIDSRHLQDDRPGRLAQRE